MKHDDEQKYENIVKAREHYNNRKIGRPKQTWIPTLSGRFIPVKNAQ